MHTLWDLDSLGIREENEVHKTLFDDIFVTEEKYQVGLPWNVGHCDLPLNLKLA